jgi:hypothetical protein
MGPTDLRTKPTERSKYSIYLKKAKEFYNIMLEAEKQKQWNAVGLNAVHCAISSCDAMTIYYAGVRSVAQNHFSAIDLLSQSIKLPETPAKCITLRKIISDKNIIEYEDRDFTQKEALEILKLTERFYNWVISKIE